MNLQTTTKAPANSLFSINFEGNGGTFAPKTANDIQTWVQKELAFWSWLQNTPGGHHDQGLRQCIGQLQNIANQTQQAAQYEKSNPAQFQNNLNELQNQLTAIYISTNFPHSSTPLAKRIEEYRSEYKDNAASFFASVFVALQNGSTFHPQNLDSWHGLIEGIIEKFNLTNPVPKGKKQASEASFEQLRLKTENLLGDKTANLEDLHREYATLRDHIQEISNKQSGSFDEIQTARVTQFNALVVTHTTEMESLRKTFREEIALRAPADYWETKRAGHIKMAWIAGVLSFGGIALSGTIFATQIQGMLQSTAPNSTPESFRLALLATIGLFTIWAIRLVVRMYLSNLHLATDASERVVMVKTYLSLLEGNRLTSNEDRQLILQALFRPATDGLVKDEGIPPSFLELMSRGSKN